MVPWLAPCGLLVSQEISLRFVSEGCGFAPARQAAIDMLAESGNVLNPTFGRLFEPNFFPGKSRPWLSEVAPLVIRSRALGYQKPRPVPPSRNRQSRWYYSARIPALLITASHF
jgi:hypothetical protein